ncbi:hypothetical protein CHELA17_61375 [Chelatococcus asaccharovorans]|nr:hypothetical protein CHELA17_61375 [Chelatococcus asaccharovorans]
MCHRFPLCVALSNAIWPYRQKTDGSALRSCKGSLSRRYWGAGQADRADRRTADLPDIA